jgi:predicted permease
MVGVLTGWGTIAIVVAVGYGLAAFGILDEAAGIVLTRLAFFVAAPCLLLTVMARTDATDALSLSLVATLLGIVAAAIPYVVLTRWIWQRRADDVVIGAMCSSYGNGANLGLPIATYILGNAALVAPMLLLQLMLLQPAALAVLDAGRSGHVSARRAVHVTVTNPLTVATFLGTVMALARWQPPAPVLAPIGLIGQMAVPAVLIAYGMSLRHGPLPGRGAPAVEIALITVLKLVVQPIAAYAAGYELGLRGATLTALAVTAALPSAQNIFMHATRFGRQQLLARDAIFVTTLCSVPMIIAITALLA